MAYIIVFSGRDPLTNQIYGQKYDSHHLLTIANVKF